jgi:hypothetical protein
VGLAKVNAARMALPALFKTPVLALVDYCQTQ